MSESHTPGRIPWNAGKGNGWTDKRGYRWVYVTRNGKRTATREHRVVMEHHLGRTLEPWELVHHKDQNPSNNSIDNLELTTWPDHNKVHHTGTRRDKALQDATAAFAQMREELKRERSIKSDLLAACKEAETQFAYLLDQMASAGEWYPNADSECASRLKTLRAAIAKAGGAA